MFPPGAICTYCEYQQAPLTRAMDAQHASLHSSLRRFFPALRPGFRKSKRVFEKVANVLLRNRVFYQSYRDDWCFKSSNGYLKLDVVFYLECPLAASPSKFPVTSGSISGEWHQRLMSRSREDV